MRSDVDAVQKFHLGESRTGHIISHKRIVIIIILVFCCGIKPLTGYYPLKGSFS